MTSLVRIRVWIADVLFGGFYIWWNFLTARQHRKDFVQIFVRVRFGLGSIFPSVVQVNCERLSSDTFRLILSCFWGFVVLGLQNWWRKQLLFLPWKRRCALDVTIPKGWVSMLWYLEMDVVCSVFTNFFHSCQHWFPWLAPRTSFFVSGNAETVSKLIFKRSDVRSTSTSFNLKFSRFPLFRWRQQDSRFWNCKWTSNLNSEYDCHWAESVSRRKKNFTSFALSCAWILIQLNDNRTHC